MIFTFLGILCFVASWLFIFLDSSTTKDRLMILSLLNGLMILFFIVALYSSKKIIFRASILISIYFFIMLMLAMSPFFTIALSEVPNLVSMIVLLIVSVYLVEKSKGKDRASWYNGKFPRFLGISFLVVLLGAVFRPLFVLWVLITMLWSVNVYIRIEENHLVYELELFKLVIYSRIYSPEEIKEVKLMRTGWMDPAANVKLYKGRDIKITYFTPNDIYQRLHRFTIDNDIKLVLTKDYEMLETRRKRREKEMQSS